MFARPFHILTLLGLSAAIGLGPALVPLPDGQGMVLADDGDGDDGGDDGDDDGDDAGPGRGDRGNSPAKDKSGRPAARAQPPRLRRCPISPPKS